ncbi:hypothetical protein CCGE531_07765 [Rhizobium sp. CCGE531]|nr:hypothetical protein CCGE531_07765 [Rhizobium sp. CCGE531]AYG72383.1 hypothetical protein CCGE532_07765 [Rhizobium sp. CCGE532]
MLPAFHQMSGRWIRELELFPKPSRQRALWKMPVILRPIPRQKPLAGIAAAMDWRAAAESRKLAMKGVPKRLTDTL